MTNEDPAAVDQAPERSILEQIFDEMFARLADIADVSEEMLRKLQHLAESGELKKHDKIMEAIQSTTRGDRETDRA